MSIRSLFSHAAILTLLLIAAPLLADEPESAGWQFLGAPYISADSDQGVAFGIASGVAHPPHTAYIIHGSISTNGLSGGTWRGETGGESWRALVVTRAWLLPIGLYPEVGSQPDPTATATFQHSELQIAWLHKWDRAFEAGPEIWTDFAQGINPVDANDIPINLQSFPRFQSGSLALFGLRGRYRTTSAIRPMDGVIIDLALRAGRADGHYFNSPRFTTASDLWLATARPLTRNSKLYLRGWFRFQDEAVPSVRNALGGENTVRGQPYSRDYGRRLLAGRFQYHITVARDFTLPSRVVQTVLPSFPTWRFELETAPFADIGAAADPDWGGWRRTRQGYGISFRIILPPELVFSFDLGFTPGGGLAYYFGGGEAL